MHLQSPCLSEWQKIPRGLLAILSHRKVPGSVIPLSQNIQLYIYIYIHNTGDTYTYTIQDSSHNSRHIPLSSTCAPNQIYTHEKRRAIYFLIAEYAFLFKNHVYICICVWVCTHECNALWGQQGESGHIPLIYLVVVVVSYWLWVRGISRKLFCFELLH